MRAFVGLAVIALGCGRRDHDARGLPDSERVRAVPDVAVVAPCDPPCEAGAACIEGMCAEPIEWTERASREGCIVGRRRAVSCRSRMVVTPVWGTEIYTADSSVCTAALHAGKIGKTGGEVIYELRPGQSSYAGTIRNGVATNRWDAYECSFVFTSKGCSAGSVLCGAQCANLELHPGHCGRCGNACAAGESCRKGACSPGVDADYLTTPGAPCSGTRTFICPPFTGGMGSVWGTSVYTDDSSVCAAALHAGVISDTKGGSVTVEMLPGRPAYSGTTSHGVISQSWGAWSCSFRFR